MAEVKIPAARLRLSPRFAVAYAAAASAMFSAGATVPTPIFRLYQEAFALSSGMVTVIFAAYALSLLAALLVAGSLSDHIGRKPLMLVALLGNLATMSAFFAAESAEALIVARVLQGAFNGLAISTLAATVLDLTRERGALINAVTPFVGLAAGAILGGGFAAFAPDPMRLVYAAMLGLTALFLLPLVPMPETTDGKPGALASLRPRVRVPRAAAGALWRITPLNVAGWGLNGLYFSLMPAIVRDTTGIGSPLIGGLVVATIALASTAGVLGLRGWSPDRLLKTFVALLVPGVGLTLLGVQAGNLALMAAGTLFSGVAIGGGFLGVLRTILPRAGAHERAGLLSAYFVQSYLALSVPAMLVGWAAPRVGLSTAATVYGVVAIAAALGSHLLLRGFDFAPEPVSRSCRN